jgi:hypothetical protein
MMSDSHVLLKKDEMSTSENQYPKTIAEAVDILHANMSLNDEILLASMNEEDLIDAHFALAYHIRHEFGLWTGNEALMESCRSESENPDLHIDDASMVIVRELWEKVKASNIMNSED